MIMAKYADFAEITAPDATDIFLLSTGAGTRKVQLGNTKPRGNQLGALATVDPAVDSFVMIDQTDQIMKIKGILSLLSVDIPHIDVTADVTLSKASHNGRTLQLGGACTTITLDLNDDIDNMMVQFYNNRGISITVTGANGAVIIQEGAAGNGEIRTKRLSTLVVNQGGTEAILAGG
jgi:hypothetical protein